MSRRFDISGIDVSGSEAMFYLFAAYIRKIFAFIDRIYFFTLPCDIPIYVYVRR